jgi:hypothetical protein
MSGLSDGVITSVLNHLFATGTYAKPTGHKIHLYTGDPYGAGDEVDAVVDDTAYAAQSITFDDEGVTFDHRVYNDALVTFPAVVYGTGAASYDVTHWVVKDGSGNLLAAGAFPVPIERLAGQPLAMNAGAIYIELTRDE